MAGKRFGHTRLAYLLLGLALVANGARADENKLQAEVGGFGDVDYQFVGNSNAFPTQNGFALGDAALVVKGQYGDHLRFLDENTIEFGVPDPSLGMDRFLVSYTFSDQFRLSAGRDHMATGYWNRTYNYAAEVMPTIERPFFIKFEDDGGIVPSHIVGLTVDGLFNLGGSSLKYEANFGNSEKILLTGDGSVNAIESEFSNSAPGDPSSEKTAAGRLVFKPWADGGLAFGVASAWNRYDTVAATPDVKSSFSGLGQVLLEGEVTYSDDNFDLFGEFYEFDDRIGGMPTQGASNNYAYYIQADVQAAESFWPYLRLENLNVNGSDPLFQALFAQNETLYLAGFRYDFIPKVTCIKLECRVSQVSDNPYTTEVDSQWAFGF